MMPAPPAGDSHWPTGNPTPSRNALSDWDQGHLGGFRRIVLVLVALLPLFGGLAGLALTALTPVDYTGEAYLLITTTADGADVSAVSIAQAVARVATSESVLDSAGSDDLLRSAAQRGDLTASASPDSPLVNLAATSSTASDAASLADEFAIQLQRHITRFEGVAQVRAEVFASASLPRDPSSPNRFVNVVSGVALGILAAAVVFVLRRP